jgi:hypothetical protein
VEYLLTALCTTIVLFVSYEFLVRYAWIGAALNGRRHVTPLFGGAKGEPQVRVGSE